MRLTNVGKFSTIAEFVDWKLNKFSSEDKTFKNLFHNMFLEEENIFCETSDGYRIKRTTYGQCKQNAISKAHSLKSLIGLPHGSTVGFYMNNAPQWIELFWAILMCGYTPLLMNMRLTDETLEKIIVDYDIQAVVSEGKQFSCKTVLVDDVAVNGEQSDISDGEWGSEVGFMSSGTSDDNVKLCFYTAENFYYQLGNSADIVKKCPQIAEHYEGELKLLTLLPFYHVFGFIAVYLWFGFFSRTFVFLKDMNPVTIQNTIKKHKVTHIFAVPLVWDTVYKKAMRTVEDRGEKVFKKFQKGLKIANSGKLGRRLTYKSMGEIRDKLFGESVKFLISGGSFISCDALQFFNGIGYHIANGYGMTEVGITSVEMSDDAKIRNLGSIGVPFKYTEYSVGENGELLIKGKNTAGRIVLTHENMPTGYSDWFNSHDLVCEKDGRYFIRGRSDDLIISKTGENLNPNLIENEIKIKGVKELCLIKSEGEPVLLLSAPSCYSAEKVAQIIESAKAEIGRLNLHNEIYKIFVTSDKLLEKGAFKISRRKIAKKYKNNQYNIFGEDAAEDKFEVLLSGLKKELTETVASVLQRPASGIGLDAHFFSDLGGTSLDYFMLSDAVRDKYGIDIKNVDGEGLGLHTVGEIYTYIKSK